MADNPVLDDPKYSYLVKRQPLFYWIWKTFFYYYCKFVFLWYTPVTVRGREKLPDSSAVFCSNHNSHMDVALLSTAAGKSFNHFGMLAAKDYWFDNALKRISVNFIMNLIPIARRSAKNNDDFPFENTIALCKAFMKLDNRNLVMFPEGSRGEPNVIRTFRKGAARFSTELDVPIVPVFIDGAARCWPKGQIFMKPTKINIDILDPLYPSQFEQESDPVSALTKKLESRIRNAGISANG